MEITGKIIAALPERSGVSARSGAEWRMASFVLETMEQYPRKMCFEIFGADRIQQMNIQVGQSYTISFDIDAREYTRQDGTTTWFNSIRAWKAEAPVAAAPAGAPAAEAPFANAAAAPFPPVQPAAAPAAPAAPAAGTSAPFGESEGDGLPF